MFKQEGKTHPLRDRLTTRLPLPTTLAEPVCRCTEHPQESLWGPARDSTPFCFYFQLPSEPLSLGLVSCTLSQLLQRRTGWKGLGMEREYSRDRE